MCSQGIIKKTHCSSEKIYIKVDHIVKSKGYFPIGYCVVCPSIYGFWLPPFGIFKLFNLDIIYLVTPTIK